MIPVGNEIITTSIGKHSCTRYSFDTGEWIHNEEQFLSFPTQLFDDTEYRSSSDGNNFYLFGKGIDGLDSSYENWCYNFAEKKWKKLESYIKEQRSATCLIQIPRDIPLCHVQCPHCKIRSLKTPSTNDIRDEKEGNDGEVSNKKQFSLPWEILTDFCKSNKASIVNRTAC
jgi:hypothetical protein